MTKNLKSLEGVTLVETTNMENRSFKTFAAPESSRFESGKHAFNQLSPIPENQIDLGDGRYLLIKNWITNGNKDAISGYLDIEVKGLICLKEQHDKKVTSKEFLQKESEVE